MTYDCRSEYFGKSEHNVWHWWVHLNLKQVTVFNLASMHAQSRLWYLACIVFVACLWVCAQRTYNSNNSKCDPTFNLEWQISVGNRKWWFIGLVKHLNMMYISAL